VMGRRWKSLGNNTLVERPPAVSSPGGAKPRPQLFKGTDFHHDADRDIMVCPGGAELHFIGIYGTEKGAAGYRLYCRPDCGGCSLKTRCTNARGRRLKVSLRSRERAATPEPAKSSDHPTTQFPGRATQACRGTGRTTSIPDGSRIGNDAGHVGEALGAVIQRGPGGDPPRCNRQPVPDEASHGLSQLRPSPRRRSRKRGAPRQLGRRHALWYPGESPGRSPCWSDALRTANRWALRRR